MIRRFLSALQSLGEREFYQMCLGCLRIARDHEHDMDVNDPSAYFREWASKEGLCLLSEAKDVASEREKILWVILKPYIGSLASFGALLPLTTYPFDHRKFDAFAPASEVPKFLRSSGNYGSALACQFIPHDTIAHDGNCGVNAFLMGINGPNAYPSTPQGRQKLEDDAREFREKVAQYLIDHESSFEQYMETGVSVRDYAQRYAQSKEWTGELELTCAAHVYRRPVILYSDNSLTVFSTDQNSHVKPTQEINPQDDPNQADQAGEIGPPVHVLLHSVHYIFLQPRPEAQ